MNRIALLIASGAAGAAACLAVMAALREPSAAPVAVASPTAAPEPVAGATAPRAPEPDADFVREVARAEEAREQALRGAILGVGDEPGLTLDARLERLREAVAAARGENEAAAAFVTPSMLAEVFLRMDGVQRELAAMSPSERAGELAHIRRELGFDEQQVARMEAIDERREARWQNGLAYMKERERIAASFEGEALEAELRALREEYFAHEAKTIEAEERGGFYRFERPRIYGRN
jgi:hypothetical protein